MNLAFEKMCTARNCRPIEAIFLNEVDKAERERSLSLFNKLAKAVADKFRPGHEVYLDFVDGDVFEAFAGTFENEDAVGIRWHVVTTLRTFYTEILEGPGPFENATKEVREAYSKWFFDCAKIFIFLHELGHIWGMDTQDC